jgi:hypothetical protein
MEYETYKIRQGQGAYAPVIDSTVKIPDKMKLITGGEHDIGHFKHDGLYHYIGFVEGDEEDVLQNIKGFCTNTFQLDKYVFITLHDIRFIEPYPYMTTADEFNKDIDLSGYYFVTWSCNLNLLKMEKITRINSEYDIDVLQANNRDYADEECLSLDVVTKELDRILDRHISLSDYHPLATKVVKGEIANDYWNTLINKTTNKFGIYLPNRAVDVDYANNLLTNNEFEELDEYITMKKAKYLEFNK